MALDVYIGFREGKLLHGLTLNRTSRVWKPTGSLFFLSFFGCFKPCWQWSSAFCHYGKVPEITYKSRSWCLPHPEDSSPVRHIHSFGTLLRVSDVKWQDKWGRLFTSLLRNKREEGQGHSFLRCPTHTDLSTAHKATPPEGSTAFQQFHAGDKAIDLGDILHPDKSTDV